MPRPIEKRPVRVANCSGYHGRYTIPSKVTLVDDFCMTGDPAYEMYRQATLGDVDFITGDYLAGISVNLPPVAHISERKLIEIPSEVNLANNAQAWRSGKHTGYEPTAWDGLQQTIDVIAQKGIRVVINGGALDPKALALKVEALVSERSFLRSPSI
jgi:hypothetical protein